MFPPWERVNIGFLFSAFLISIGILFFILNLGECLQYLGTLRVKLFEETRSNDIITSTVAKIILYNVFDEKMTNLNLTNITDNLKNIDKNLSLFNITATSGLSPVYLDLKIDTGPEYLMKDILIKLYRPILFICLFVLLKVII
jgi:hypothetical protein